MESKELSDLDKAISVIGYLIEDLKKTKEDLFKVEEWMASLFMAIEQGRVLNFSNIQECQVAIRLSKLDNYLKKQVSEGFFTACDCVTENSVVVCRVFNDENMEIQKKILMSIAELNSTVKELFLNKKPSDVIVLKNDNLTVDDKTKEHFYHILEVYNINNEVKKL